MGDVYIPPDKVAFTITADGFDIPEALRGSLSSFTLFTDDSVVVNAIPQGDNFKVMELEFTVNPVSDGIVTVTFSKGDNTNTVLEFDVSAFLLNYQLLLSMD